MIPGSSFIFLIFQPFNHLRAQHRILSELSLDTVVPIVYRDGQKILPETNMGQRTLSLTPICKHRKVIYFSGFFSKSLPYIICTFFFLLVLGIEPLSCDTSPVLQFGFYSYLLPLGTLVFLPFDKNIIKQTSLRSRHFMSLSSDSS